MEQVEVINTCLRLFCNSFGQKVSIDKTRICFSKNVHWSVRRDNSSEFGFQRTGNLSKYLGAPLFHKQPRRGDFQFILDKASQRLSDWKRMQLSFAGKMTLTKFVLASLPNYIMQTSLLPVSICNELDKCSRQFVWGDTADHRIIHMVAWDNICRPRNKGGLGLRHARLINQSLLM